MNAVYYLTSRNLAIFLQNKKNIILSFISIFIVVGLYVIFLRDFILSSVLDCHLPQDISQEFTDRMMAGGLLVVVNTTTCFGVVQGAVKDHADGIQKDFLITPIRKMQLITSYWLTCIEVSFFYTTLTAVTGEVYFYFAYGRCFASIEALQLIFVLLTCSMVNGAILLCLITFIQDTTTFSTFGNLYGMLIGFLAGVYLPYKLYPKKLRDCLFYYPPTQLVSILRQIYLRNWSNRMDISYGAEIVKQLREIYGVDLTHMGEVCSSNHQWAVLVVGMAVFLIFLTLVNQENEGWIAKK